MKFDDVVHELVQMEAEKFIDWACIMYPEAMGFIAKHWDKSAMNLILKKMLNNMIEAYMIDAYSKQKNQ